jgi:hypothetical protein
MVYALRLDSWAYPDKGVQFLVKSIGLAIHLVDVYEGQRNKATSLPKAGNIKQLADPEREFVKKTSRGVWEQLVRLQYIFSDSCLKEYWLCWGPMVPEVLLPRKTVIRSEACKPKSCPMEDFGSWQVLEDGSRSIRPHRANTDGVDLLHEAGAR